METANPLAKKICERYDSLQGLRQPWQTLWSEIAKYIMPRRVPGLNGTVQSPGTGNEALLFDSTAVQANMTLANGQLAWMSPMESAWFGFEAEKKNGQTNDDESRWLAAATEAARDALATCNFYTAIHEFYLDRGAFGTACLYLEPGSKSLLNAQCWPVGTFVIDEDENGNVDTVIREFTLTPRQAIQKFGEENVSQKVRDAVKDVKKAGEKLKFRHAIYPREDADRDKAKMDAPNMPIASVYVEADSMHVCKTSGYEEMPVFVSRYLEWGSGIGSLYGWSPGFSALPDARQVNFLQKMMDALAEKAAFPPVLAPDELEGEIDGNAHGVTYFSRDLASGNAMPKEWMTQGRYDIGLQRIQERQKSIRDAFHVDLFQMFAQIQKQMTAREVAERSQEKLIQFSPTFARLTTELFNPLLERVFGILLRAGKLGEVPQTMIVAVSKDMGYIPPPRLQYASRIALALRALPSLGYARTLERLAGVMQVAPSALDNFDFDKAERATSLSDGVPAEFLRSAQDVKQLRDARAAQAAQAEKEAKAAAAAETLSKVGRIPTDSPVLRIAQQAQQAA